MLILYIEKKVGSNYMPPCPLEEQVSQLLFVLLQGQKANSVWKLSIPLSFPEVERVINCNILICKTALRMFNHKHKSSLCLKLLLISDWAWSVSYFHLLKDQTVFCGPEKTPVSYATVICIFSKETLLIFLVTVPLRLLLSLLKYYVK